MSACRRLLSAGDLKDGAAAAVSCEGRVVAVFNRGGLIRALEDACPHMGGPLSEGSVRDGVVVCPWHGWSYDLADGSCREHPGVRAKTYEAKVEGGDVLISL